MLKRRKVMGIFGVLTSMLLFTGCSTQLVELTDEERQAIVDYSAHVVGEFNLLQDKGYIALSKEVLDALDESKQENTEQEDDKQESNQQNSEDGTDEGDEEEIKSTTLTEALGITGVEATVRAYEIADGYSEGSVAGEVIPEEGGKLIVIRCNLTNVTEEDVRCDIYSKGLEFSIDINDGEKKVASLANVFFLSDLTTMVEDLAPGTTKEAVILFEIPSDVAGSVKSLKLIVKNASTNHTIFMN